MIVTPRRQYALHPMIGDRSCADVNQLVSELGVAGSELYSLDNLKNIKRTDPPIIVRNADGRAIKIRCFPSEREARAMSHLLGNGIWPHIPIILGRCGRAVAEDWIEGRSVGDDRYRPDWLREAGQALGKLHASLPRPDRPGARWVNAVGWVRETSHRVCALTSMGLVDERGRRRLLQIVDRHAPDNFECGLTHGDFAPDNLLVDSQDRLYCIDNETVCIDPLDYDLVRTIVRWPLTGARRRAFLAAYSAYRDPQATASQCAFWLVAVLARAAQWETQHKGAPSDRVVYCLRRIADTSEFSTRLPGKRPAKTTEPLGLTFLGLRIDAVSQDEGLLAWLKEFLTPQFTAAEPRRRGDAWTVDVRGSEADYLELEAVFAPLQCPSVPVFLRDEDWDYARDCGEHGDGRVFFLGAYDTFLTVDLETRRIRLCTRRNEPRSRLAAMKAIRELAMCEVWGGGRLMLHAAAYASDGNGCLILGPKGAGKTTLLTYLLHCGSARYVTNDRAAVVKGENGFSIHGIPTIVSLRSGTTGYFPKLREGQQDRAYRQLQTLAEAHEAAVPSELPRQMIDHPDLSPAQYTTHLACATDGAAHLAAVLVPNIRTDHDGLGGRGYRITRLDLDCARTAIHNALFGPEGACPGGGLLPAAVPMAADLADRRTAILNDLSRFIPCFQVDIHETAYATSDLADALSLLAGASDHPAERRSIS